MNTLDVIVRILKENEGVSSFTFAKYPMQTLIQEEKAYNKTDLKFIDSALEVRKKFRMPFWDSLMLTLFDQEGVSEDLLQRALKHNKNVDKIYTSDVNEILSVLESNPHFNLSLNSEVQFEDGSILHLFLLDFHVYPSDNNLKLVSDILKVMGLRGFILSSGESYHFVSKDFFSTDAILDLLAKSLLFAPIVDRAWVAHQILERSCSVRVGKKHGVVPTVIREL